MSKFAKEVLMQLARGPVEAGDLISKSGRDELVRLSMCCYRDGMWCLTEFAHNVICGKYRQGTLH